MEKGIEITKECVIIFILGQKKLHTIYKNYFYSMSEDPKEFNPSESLAKNVVQSVMFGEVPNLSKEANKIDYNARSSLHLRKTNTFYQAMFSAIPYETIAQIQSRQIKAVKTQKLSWGTEAVEDIIAQKIAEIGFYLLHMWRNLDNELMTICAIPNWEYIDRALDKLYKLGGFYAAEKHEHALGRPLEDQSDEELLKLVSQHVDIAKLQSPTIIEQNNPTNEKQHKEAKNT